MKKKIIDDEIDLIDLSIVVWKKKLSILSFTLFFVFLMFIYQSIVKEPTKFNARTEIRAISVFEESKYNVYNSLLKSLKPLSFKEQNKDLKNLNANNLQITSDGVSKESNLDNLEDFISLKINNDFNVNSYMKVNNINQKFLFDLFIEQINQKSNLARYLMKFQFIDRKNYANDLEYRDAAYQIASSIKLKFNENNDSISKRKTVFIEYQTYDLAKWKNFLESIEAEINSEIQKNISLMLENYLNYIQTLTKFKMEDTDLQSSISDQKQKKYLEKKKELLKSDRYIQRVKNIYASSPLSNPEEFYAGKIIFDTIKFDSSVSKNSMVKQLILTGIMALAVGIFIVLISYTIEKRR